MTSSRKMGFYQIILSGLCFGLLGFFGKMAFRYNIGPGELLALRYFISALLTGAYLLMTDRRSLFSLNLVEIISSLCLGIFGYALFSSLYFMALSGVSASLTVLLLYTYPLMIMIFSHFFLKETMGPRGFVAAMLVTLGLMGLVYGEWSVSRPIFLLYGLGSAFFYAIYILLSRKFLGHVSAFASSFYVQLGAGVVLSMIHFHTSLGRPLIIISMHPVLIISMAIICSLFAMTLFLAGLQKITSFEASVLSTTEPISGVFFATLLLGEKLELLQVIGGISILMGIILIANKRPASAPEIS